METESAGYVWQEEENDKFAAIVVWKSMVEICTNKDRKGNEGAIRSLHSCSQQIRLENSAYDESSEVRDASVGQVAHRSKDVEKVQLGVFEGLPDLVRLQFLVLDTSLVVLHSEHHNSLLVISQELRSHWRVWHEDQDDDSPHRAERAHDDEFEFPCWETSMLDGAHAIADKSTAGNADPVATVDWSVRRKVGHRTIIALLFLNLQVPHANSNRLFRSLPIHRRDEHE